MMLFIGALPQARQDGPRSKKTSARAGCSDIATPLKATRGGAIRERKGQNGTPVHAQGWVVSTSTLEDQNA